MRDTKKAHEVTVNDLVYPPNTRKAEKVTGTLSSTDQPVLIVTANRRWSIAPDEDVAVWVEDEPSAEPAE